MNQTNFLCCFLLEQDFFWSVPQQRIIPLDKSSSVIPPLREAFFWRTGMACRCWFRLICIHFMKEDEIWKLCFLLLTPESICGIANVGLKVCEIRFMDADAETFLRFEEEPHRLCRISCLKIRPIWLLIQAYQLSPVWCLLDVLSHNSLNNNGHSTYLYTVS